MLLAAIPLAMLDSALCWWISWRPSGCPSDSAPPFLSAPPPPALVAAPPQHSLVEPGLLGAPSLVAVGWEGAGTERGWGAGCLGSLPPPALGGWEPGPLGPPMPHWAGLSREAGGSSPEGWAGAWVPFLGSLWALLPPSWRLLTLCWPQGLLARAWGFPESFAAQGSGVGAVSPGGLFPPLPHFPLVCLNGATCC